MPAATRVPLEVRTAAARITAELCKERLVQTDSIINPFVKTCHALSSEWSAVDVVLALQPSVRRQLEAIALRHFQLQLRPRARARFGAIELIPRAITELRSASKAWDVSPLVLLVEFADGPESDNFWRAVSKLARCGDGGIDDWRLVRKRLHVARDRRRQDVLARRKGVSRTQPWAIPDVQAVLQLRQQEQGPRAVEGRDPEHDEERQREASIPSNIGRRMTSKHHSRTPLIRHGIPTRKGAQSQGLASGRRPSTRRKGLNDRHLEPIASSSDDKDGNRTVKARLQQVDVREEAGEVYQSASSSDSNIRHIMWPLTFGWWLWNDIMYRLCTSLAQLQPTRFAAIDPQVSDLASPATGTCLAEPTVANLIAPIFIKSSTHWALGLISSNEKLISLFDPLPSTSSRADATAAIKRIFTRLLPGERLVDWTIVPRSCPMQQNGVESGVGVVVTALYCLVRRHAPFSIDVWLWRHLLARYLSQMSQDMGEAEMVRNLAESHRAMYQIDEAVRCVDGNSGTPQPSLAERRAALRENGIEARAVWAAAAANLAADPEVEDGVELCIQQDIRKVRSAVDAVLTDIDQIERWLESDQRAQSQD